MTLNIKVYQEYGKKTDKLIEEHEFCCWHSLYRYLSGFSSLNKCPDCEKTSEDKKQRRDKK